jgi:coniferyl-aldehyde dehydrogenase
MIHADRVPEFADAASSSVARMYPAIRNNPDYTSMVNVRGFERQQALIADAAGKGGSVISLGTAGEDLSDPAIRKVAPTLVLGATDEMRVMQEEIFGPVLPVMTYRTLDEAIAYVNARPRPLALYFFRDDQGERELVSARTTSGAVVVNDAMTHVFVNALPFGGIGASGMGHYHGQYGFRALSHAKPVLLQSQSGDSNRLMQAPYDEQLDRLIRDMIWS